MTQFIRGLSALLMIGAMCSCSKQSSPETTSTKKQTDDNAPMLASNLKKPNILWIYVEDISPHLGSDGEPLVHTPTLDEIASQGTKFTNTIMPAPVCSAGRSAMMTGMMQTTTGVHNHHSARTPESAFYLPKDIKTLPELFKDAGYYTFNSGKDDYNFSYNREDLYEGDYAKHPLYGQSGLKTDWSDRPDKDQPFFGQIQLKGGKQIFSRTFKDKIKYPIDRSKIKLPPYYPNDPVVINEWARYLESMEITDREVASIFKKLEADGELENTLVLFFADHGTRFLRHKQFLYEGGIKVPFIAYWKGQPKIVKTTQRDELISGLDISATSLAIAGIQIPDYFEGKNLFDPQYKAKEFVISARDRCDFTIDRIRSVRTERFKYIKNFYPERSGMQPSYRDEWQLTKVSRELYEQGKLNSVQAKHFRPTREPEELYDLVNDPHEINNLVANKEYAKELIKHRNILNLWIKNSNDLGQYPEREESLKLMLGIWGDTAINPEFDELRKQYPNLSGSQYSLKNARFEKVEKL
ncbi:sulfatase family protein [Shewanella kaireitica]|uniref:sulfatase family protein n=1 Tax=Shewanella kaireitica TaxID=212021 RepID=UPI00200EED4E|nr:sulfatase [Shewanella kaireitica]MCL1096127.1 sulfatase [Shewanella kaireitica]